MQMLVKLKSETFCVLYGTIFINTFKSKLSYTWTVKLYDHSDLYNFLSFFIMESSEIKIIKFFLCMNNFLFFGKFIIKANTLIHFTRRLSMLMRMTC